MSKFDIQYYKLSNLTSSSFIEIVKADDKAALEVFYNEQKSSFVAWANSRFDADYDTIIDVYQDAIVTLYFNIKEDKISSFEISAEAYLFGIARNLLHKRNLKAQREPAVDDLSKLPQEVDYNIYDRIDKAHDKFKLEQAFKLLKGKCRELIYLFYYHKFSMESIAERLDYRNTDVVKSKKNQCMKQLKEIFR